MADDGRVAPAGAGGRRRPARASRSSADDAVRIALAYSPALQAMLYEGAATSAAATAVGAAAQPGVRLRAPGRATRAGSRELEITRTLSLSILDLILLPTRLRLAEFRQQTTRLRPGERRRAGRDDGAPGLGRGRRSAAVAAVLRAGEGRRRRQRRARAAHAGRRQLQQAAAGPRAGLLGRRRGAAGAGAARRRAAAARRWCARSGWTTRRRRR